MRSSLPIAALLLAAAIQAPVFAQTATPAAPATPPAPAAATPAPAAATPAAPKPKDPVVAKVNGEPIHLSALSDLAQNLPPQLQGMPMQAIYPLLLNQAIDEHALAIAARKAGVAKDPLVQRRIAEAKDQVLQSAFIRKQVGPQITEAAIKTQYEKEYANKPGVVEVHAKHILVKTKAVAEKIIAKLKAGAKFSDLAKKYSTDPGGKNGGDLGFFKKTDMVAAFADAAFAMKPGTVSQTPVHTQFGWHVIKVIARRTDPAPALKDVHDKIRQALIRAAIQHQIALAVAAVKIERFNPDGSPVKPAAPAAPTTPATPAPAPAPAKSK